MHTPWPPTDGPRRVTPATEDLQRYASGSMDGSGYGLAAAPPMPGSPPMPARAPAPAAAPAYPRQLTRTASQESSLLAPQHLGRLEERRATPRHTFLHAFFHHHCRAHIAKSNSVKQCAG